MEWPRAGGGQAARIRERDWSATPLGSIEAWPQPLRTAVEMMLASPILASLAVGPERVFLHNDEAARHYGDRHPGVLGQPLAEAFAHEFAAVAPFYERVFAGESLHVPAQPLDPARSGTGEVFDAYLVPVRDVGGEVIAVAMTGFAIGGRLRTEAAHRASEEERRSLIAQMNQGFCILEVILDEHDEGIDYRFLETNPAFRRQAGFEPAGRLMSEIAPIEPIWPKAYGRVALTGTPEWIVDAAASFDRKYEVYAFRIGAAAEHRIAVFFSDITARAIAEDRLRESEERQAFLLKLSDALRPIADPVDIQDVAVRVLAEHLHADRTYYAVVEGNYETALIEREYIRGVAPSVVGRHAFSSFGSTFEAYRVGRTMILSDVEAPDAVPISDLPAFRALSIRSLVSTPLFKNGRTVASMTVLKEAPHGWTGHEVSLVQEVAERTWAAVERARAEAALRDSEERQAFLLNFTDALRPLIETGDIERQATRLLGEHLKADRCFLSPVYEDGTGMCVREEYLRSGASSVLGDYTFAQFGDFVGPELHAGRILAVEDVAALTSLSSYERASYAAVAIGAYLLIPLVRDGRLAAFLTINHRTPRAWSDADKAVARQTADRLWAARERGRAEAALRRSEERFAQFALSSSDILWIRDAETLAIEFISSAAASIYGVEPKMLLGDPRPGSAMIVPEDRQDVFDNIVRVRGGEAVVHDYRIQHPSDGTFRWMRSTGFPLPGPGGRIEKIGGITTDFTEAKLAAEHQSVLLAELQHRVRNIMAMIRSITARTGESAETVQGYGELMMGRLLALARVQALLTRAANVSVNIRSIVQDEVSVQAQYEGQYVLDGPDMALSPKAAEVLTLAIHELATNALKYGALSVPYGKVTVTWTIFEKRETSWLGFDWTEEGAPEQPQSTEAV